MADIFRILSRGSNLKRPRNEVPSLTPGVTNKSNSTIFIESSERRAKKPKKDTKLKDENEEDIPQELDFFGTGSKGLKSKAENLEKEESEGRESDNEEVESEEDEAMEEVATLSEEETRRILKENKLKIVKIFPVEEEPKEKEGEEDTGKAKKKKKDKKKAKAKEEESKKSKKKNKFPQAIVPPLQTFEELRGKFQLSKRICANIQSRNYPTPTQVQVAALPLLMDPSAISPPPLTDAPLNLLVCAPTGSGKTLAFTLPLLSKLLALRKTQDRSKPTKSPGPYALILAPTRELAFQIVNEIRKFAQRTGIRATLVRKGVDISVVKSEILVGTPGVIAAEIQEGKGGGLKTVKQLILDEADVLLDEMFREQTLAVWEGCKAGKGTSLQVSLWSATMPSSTESLAKDLITATGASDDSTATPNPTPVIYRLTVGIQASSLPPISHTLTYCATESGKLLAVRQMLTSPTGFPTPALIFTQNVTRASALQSELHYDLPQTGRVAVLSSALSETKRMETMEKFRQGEIWLLITTDLLARGVDFAGVKLVINYDIPQSVASFIHRVGRTARGGNKGRAVTLYTKEDIPYVRGIAGVVDRAEGGKQGWLLDKLPKTSKRDKKRLKERGVEGRRDVKITTRSSWERKKEMNRKGAKEGSKRRKKLEEGEGRESGSEGGSDGEDWGGISM